MNTIGTDFLNKKVLVYFLSSRNKSLYLLRRKHCGDWSFAVPPTYILPSISDCFVDMAMAHHRIPSVLKSTSAREVLKLAPREANISSIRTPSGREKFHRPLTPSTSLKAVHAR